MPTNHPTYRETPQSVNVLCRPWQESEQCWYSGNRCLFVFRQSCGYGLNMPIQLYRTVIRQESTRVVFWHGLIVDMEHDANCLPRIRMNA